MSSFNKLNESRTQQNQLQQSPQSNGANQDTELERHRKQQINAEERQPEDNPKEHSEAQVKK